MFSPTCQYAIRALVVLAQTEGGGPLSARDIAAAQGIPHQFLSKILYQLTLKGLVRSQKGPRGGFWLARPPAELTLADIAVAVDGVPAVSRRCILGLEECGETAPCALHDAWKTFRNLYEAIGALTLRDMVANVERKGIAPG